MEDLTSRFQDPDDVAPLTEESHEILWRGEGAARLERLVTADPDTPNAAPNRWGGPVAPGAERAPELQIHELRNVYLIGDHESALIVNASFDAHAITEATQGRLIPAIVFTSDAQQNTGAAEQVSTWVDCMLLTDLSDGERFSIAGCEIIALQLPPQGPASSAAELSARAQPSEQMAFHCPAGSWVITERPEHERIRALPAGTTVFPVTGAPFEIQSA